MAITTDYQAEVRTLTIGEGTDYGIARRGIGGFGGPSPSTRTMTRGGGHGSVHGKNYYDERLLAIPMRFTAATGALAMAKFNAFKAQWRPTYDETAEDELKVRLPGFASSDQIYRYYGQYQSVEDDLTELVFGHITALATFLATDPLAYGPETSTAVDASSPLAITNNGSMPTERFRLTVVGNGGTPVITSTTDDSSVVSFAVALSGTAVLDFFGKDVTVSSNPAFDQLSPGPRWFRLLPGANSITFTGCASVQATYQEAYV